MTYSHKDFTSQTLIERTDLNGQFIRGSCFSQQVPDSVIFPEGMTGVTYLNCNLENCVIPEGNTVIDCETRRYAVQNDGNGWEIDENNVPTTVVDYLHFFKTGKKMPNPADIPNKKVSERVNLRGD